MNQRDREEIELLHKQLIEVKTYLKSLADENPFYVYNPTIGRIGDKERQFLSAFLDEDDIPDQINGSKDVHLSTADLVCISGSNQSGKSVTAAMENIIQGSHMLPESLRNIYPTSKFKTKGANNVFRIVGVDDKQLFNTVIPSYRKWTPKKVLKNGSFDDSFTVRGKDGQKVLKIGDWKNNDLWATYEFMTNKMDVESFQGPMRVKITYDEQPLEVIHEENMARLSAAPQGVDCLFAFTATKGITWATQLFDNEHLVPGKIERYQLSALNNPAIIGVNIFNYDDYIKGILQPDFSNLKSIYSIIKDKDIIKIRLLGMFVSLFGLIYQGIFDRNIHIIKPFPINRKDFIIYRGLDPHSAKPSCALELAVDRDMNQYVVGCFKKKCDTELFKEHLAKRAKDRNYRLGWAICDTSADTDNAMLGNRNIFKELRKGNNAISGMFKSGKGEGSIHAGVNVIKTLLRGEEQPKLYIFDIPENKELIKSFLTIERSKGVKEEEKGIKDKIEEGKHDFHACLRYIQQRNVVWYAEDDSKVKTLEPLNYI